MKLSGSNIYLICLFALILIIRQSESALESYNLDQHYYNDNQIDQDLFNKEDYRKFPMEEHLKERILTDITSDEDAILISLVAIGISMGVFLSVIFLPFATIGLNFLLSAFLNGNRVSLPALPITTGQNTAQATGRKKRSKIHQALNDSQKQLLKTFENSIDNIKML